jgi:hypothetical protein
MEATVSFSIGTFRPKTKQEKEAKKKKDAEAARLKARKKHDAFMRSQIRRGRCAPQYRVCRHLNLDEAQWIIIPSVPYELHRIAYSVENQPFEIMKAVRRNKDLLLRRAAYKNQRVRNAFSALARRWIYRKFQQGNEEDLMTCEVPVNPIVLTDWENRRKYVFEPRTIYRDMVSRLQSSVSSFFPKPQMPRNPYTNMQMTYGQFIGVVQQLRSLGMTHWTIDSLYSSHYCLKKFDRENYWKLRETILKNLFTSSTNMDGNTLVLDFIDEAFESTPCEYYTREAYKWGMETMPDNQHLAAWRALCYKHYRISNAIPANEEADKIAAQAERLCKNCLGFIIMYMKANPSAARPAPHTPVVQEELDDDTQVPTPDNSEEESDDSLGDLVQRVGGFVLNVPDFGEAIERLFQETPPAP